MNPSDDLYIRVLKYCRDNIETPLTPNQIVEHINKTTGGNFHEYGHDTRLDRIIHFALGGHVLNPSMQYQMLGEAYFKLLEFEELSLARKNAKEAKRFSIAAIIIAILVGVVEVISNILL